MKGFKVMIICVAAGFAVWVTVVFGLLVLCERKYEALSEEHGELVSAYEELEEKYENETGSFALRECPFCDGKAKMVQIGDSFRIQCEECEVETAFFHSKKEAAELWNGNME